MTRVPGTPPQLDADRPDRTSDRVWRVIDANANRAAEGLRVVEDFFRFVRDDAANASRCKHLRHRLASLVEQLPWAARIAARDTRRDVGRTVETPEEYQRQDPQAVARANLHRVTQSLRCLEEYTKLTAGDVARGLEALRYDVYEIELHVSQLTSRPHQLLNSTLCILLDGQATTSEFAHRVREVAAGGTGVVQLRDKSLSDRELLARAICLRELANEFGFLAIVNDRCDIARLADVDGVHLGQDDLRIDDARRLLPNDMLIGVSTHSLAQAIQADRDGADYLGVGPVFPSTTKSFESFPGLELVAEVAQHISRPAFAIGGISLDNLDQIIKAGLRRVAVSGAVSKSQDATAVCQRFRQRLGEPDQPREPQELTSTDESDASRTTRSYGE